MQFITGLLVAFAILFFNPDLYQFAQNLSGSAPGQKITRTTTPENLISPFAGLTAPQGIIPPTAPSKSSSTIAPLPYTPIITSPATSSVDSDDNSQLDALRKSTIEKIQQVRRRFNLREGS